MLSNCLEHIIYVVQNVTTDINWIIVKLRYREKCLPFQSIKASPYRCVCLLMLY